MPEIKSYTERLSELEIRSDMAPERNQVLVSFKGSGSEYGKWSEVFTEGNISTIIGKAKSCKSFFISMLTAGIMKKKYPQIFSNVSGNIVLFDTEQGKYHVWMQANRIARLLNILSHPARLKIFCLRPLTVKERIEVIENYLYLNDVQFCFIDGVRDLVTDINDQVQANNVVGKLMKWSFERKTHICSILHQNKDNDYARGHIGSEIVNKSESVIQVAKHSKDDKITIVSSVHSRGMEFQSFMFTINDGLPEILGQVQKPGNLTTFGRTKLTTSKLLFF